ncbi:MAG: FadR family transcriptional regulator [Deltaproteobacteria bacterium]|nr:FadR family transcriptional regulator [Deltaproteobacteria bacterium]
MSNSLAYAPASAPPSPPVAKSLGGPIERSHASDQVFRDIAAAILNRELPSDRPLPPERELAERFGVSRIVVREAIHRLKEYDLVRVRQGSPTMVLDPDRSTDMRLLGLELELVEPTPEGIAPFRERQLHSCAALLDLAEQRISSAELDALDALVTAEELAGPATPRLEFERAFWTTIARATGNRLFLRETLWYFALLGRDPRFHALLPAPTVESVPIYRALLVPLRARSGSAALYLSFLRASSQTV